jgi:hypothetical protein
MRRVTDSDLGVISGRRDQLVGRLQERYGMAKEEAQKQADEFVKSLKKESREDEREQEKVAARKRPWWYEVSGSSSAKRMRDLAFRRKRYYCSPNCRS